MIRKTKEQKAITITSLIITVVVLLILATVAINSVVNDGIISKAKEVANKFNEAQAKEQNMLEEYLNYLNPSNGGGSGNGSGIGDATVGTKVTSLSTINGQAYNENNPVIPAGFKAIETPTTKWDETKLAEEVKKGLVISDDANNQFVWIPVANINNMIMCQTHGASVSLDQTTLQCPTCGANTKLAGKLYATGTGETFNSTLSTQTYGLNKGIREPDVVTGTSGTDSTVGSSYDAGEDKLSIVLEGDYANTKTAVSFKSQLETEFTKMAQSVAKYKGFYVGRYETSLSSNVAQSKSEETPMKSINWYNMYKNSKTYSRNNEELGVVSEMIWGCQYDAMLQLILTGPDASHVTATTNVGHTSSDFSSKPYETGGTNYSEVYSGTTEYNDIASNIYDLEGNVMEWTQESVFTYSRVPRGGNYSNSYSPSNRRYDSTIYGPADTSSGSGSRLSLYVGL